MTTKISKRGASPKPANALESTRLPALVAALLRDRALAPADWIGGSTRTKLVPLADTGVAASPELVEYMRAAEDLSFRKAVGSVWSHDFHPAPVRVPSSLMFRGSASSVVAFLAGTQPIAEDPDSGAVLVAAWGTPRTKSAVASFLFNDGEGDFVVEAASIRSYLERHGDDGPRPVRSPLTVELERHYRRSIWLGQIFYDTADWYVDDPIDGTIDAMRDAAPLAAYDAERKECATRPNLAAHWLLWSALLGRNDVLIDVLARSSHSIHPVVIELRRKLAPIVKGKPVIEPLLRKHQSDWPADMLAQIRKAAPAR